MLEFGIQGIDFVWTWYEYEDTIELEFRPKRLWL